MERFGLASLGWERSRSQFQPATRQPMVKAQITRVHAKAAGRGTLPAYPQNGDSHQSWVKSCAHTAIIPTNSVSDARAAASSTKIFNMLASKDPEFYRTYAEHCSFYVLIVKAKNRTPIGSVNKSLRR
jgi:hypothetical protein